MTQFNAQDFFGAHEHWEAAWKAVPVGPEKTLLGALIQLAAGLHQARRGKVEGARRLLARAEGKLVVLPSELAGLDVDELQTLITHCREGLAPVEEGTPWEAPVRLRMLRETPGSPAVPSRHRCPYCGEPVEVQVDDGGAASETYVEDCPVCCRPWTVSVERNGAQVQVNLSRDD